MIFELLLNFGGTWLITKHVNRWLFLIPTLLLLAFLSGLAREFLDYYLQAEQVTSGKMLLTAISMAPINLFVCLCFAVFFRKRRLAKS